MVGNCAVCIVVVMIDCLYKYQCALQEEELSVI